MNDKTKAANLARAFNNAATLFTNPTIDLADGAPKDIASSLAELASAIYSEANALYEGENLETAPAAAKKAASSGGGWKGGGGSSGSDGPTEKQTNFASKLIAKILEEGDVPEMDLSAFKELGSVPEASDVIGRLKEVTDQYDKF